MNKIYRAIWNESTQTWVAASELAKSKTKANTVSCQMPVVSTVLSKLGSKVFKIGLIASVVNMTIGMPIAYAAGRAQIVGEIPTRGSDNRVSGYLNTASINAVQIMGDNSDFCGYDRVAGRDINGAQRNQGPSGLPAISAMEEYLRFAQNYTVTGTRGAVNGRTLNPYGTTNHVENWGGQGWTTDPTNGSNGTATSKAPISGYMDQYATGGYQNGMGSAFGVNSAVMGCGSYASGNHSLSFGAGAFNTGGGAQAVGNFALAGGRASNAIGISSQATGVSSVALGSVANSDGVGSVALGLMSQASIDGAVAVGVKSQASGDSSVAIGNDTIATGKQGISIGNGNVVYGEQSIAIGGSTTPTAYKKDDGTEASGPDGYTFINANNTLSLGNSNKSTSPNNDITAANTAIFGNQNTIINAIYDVHVIGSGNTVGSTDSSGIGATIIGNNASVTTDNGLALGNNTIVNGTGAIAVGTNAKAMADGSVALGSDSIANTAGNVSGYNPDTNVAATDPSLSTPTWKSTTGAVAVGNSAKNITRQITDLAAGTLDTDAVNVAQLKSLYSSISGSASSLSTAIDANVSVVKTKINSASISTSDVITNLNQNITKASGDADDKLAQINTDISSLSTSTSSSIGALQTSALVFKNGVYNVGSDDGRETKKITNLTDARITDDSTDMVNGGQLFSTNSSLSSISTAIYTNISNLNEGTSNLVSVVNTSVSTIDSNINSFTTTTDKGIKDLRAAILKWNGSDAFDAGNEKKITNVEAGSIDSADSTDAVTGAQLRATNMKLNKLDSDIQDSLTDNNLKIDKFVTDTNIALSSSNKSLDGLSTSISTGLSQITRNALLYDATTGAFVEDKNKTPQKISNAAEGDVIADSDDAITGGQLYTVNSNLASLSVSASTGWLNISGKRSSLTTDTANSLTNLSTAITNNLNSLTTSANSSLSTLSNYLQILSDSASTAISGLQESTILRGEDGYFHATHDGTAQKITGVAPGDISSPNSTDMVNGGQLFSTNTAITNLSSTVNTQFGSLSVSASLSVGQSLDKLSTSLATTGSKVAALQEDALQWNDDDAAYSASHGDADTKITHVSAGDITSATSTDAVVGSQYYDLNTSIDARVSTLTTSALSTVGEINSSISSLQQQMLQYTDGKYNAKRVEKEQKITGVADAALNSASTDAINAKQLYTTNSTLDTVSTTISSGLSTLAGNINQTAVNTLQSGMVLVNGLNSSISTLKNNALLWNETDKAFSATHDIDGNTKITNVANGYVAAGSTDAINAGQIFSFSTSASTGIQSLSTGLNGLSVQKIKELSSSIQAGVTGTNNKIATLKQNVLLWNADAYDASHGSSRGKITHVADGNLQSNSTDAVTMGQLYTTSTSISTLNTDVVTKPAELSTKLDVAMAATNTSLNNTISGSISSLSDKINTDIGTANSNINALKQTVLQWNGSSYDASHGQVGGKNKIINAAQGNVNDKSSDAVIGDQLSMTNTKISGLTSDLTSQLQSLSGSLSGSLASVSTTMDRSLSSGLNTFASTIDTSLVPVNASLSTIKQNALQWNGSAYDAGGTQGIKRKIINVDKADLQAKSSDAVIGAQLFSTNSQISALSSSFDNKVSDFTSATSSSLNSLSTALENSSFSGLESLSTTTEQRLQGINGKLPALLQNALQWKNGAYDASHGVVNGKNRITNAADGSLAKGSKDAITGNQLYNTNSAINDLANEVKSGIGNLSSALSTISDKNISTLTGLLAQTNTKVSSLSTAAGTQLGVINNGVSDLQKDALQWKRLDDSGAGAYDASHGIANAKNTLTHVFSGNVKEGSSDAIIGAQLYSTNNSISVLNNKLADVSGSMQAGISSLSTSLDQVTGSNLAKLTQSRSTIENNITSLSSSISSGLSTADGSLSTLKTNALQWKDGAYDASRNDKNSRITNVAKADIYDGSTDAITAGQLYSTENSFDTLNSDINKRFESFSTTLSSLVDIGISSLSAGITGINTGVSTLQQNALQWDASISAYDAGSATGARAKITQVAAGQVGESSSDAVIGAQLYSLSTVSDANLTSSSNLMSSSLSTIQSSLTGISDKYFTQLSSLSDSILSSTINLSGASANSLSTLSDTLSNSITSLSNSTNTGLNSLTADAANSLSSLSTVAESGISSLSQSISTSAGTLITSLSTVNHDAGSLKQNALQWNDYAAAYNADHGTGTAQKITNVSTGLIASGSNDAVNGAQLYSLSTSMENTANTAFTGLSDALVSSISTVDSNLQSFSDTTTSNLSRLDTNLRTATARVTTLQANTLQWNGSVYDAGKNGTPQRITNVSGAASVAANSTDVINGGQLFSLSSSTSTGLSSLASNLSEMSKNQLGSLSTVVTNSLSSITNNIDSLSTGLSSTTNNVAALQRDALQWNSAKGAYSADHGTNTAQLITSVAAGSIAADSTDAVNGAQMYNLSTSTTASVNTLNQSLSSTNVALNTLSTAYGTSLSTLTTGLSSTKDALNQLSDTTTNSITGINNSLSSLTSTTSSNLQILDKGLQAANASVSSLQANALLWNTGKGVYDASRNGEAKVLSGIGAGAVSVGSTEAINGGQFYSLSTVTAAGLNSTNSNLSTLSSSTSSALAGLTGSLSSINQSMNNLQTTALQWNGSFYDAGRDSSAQRITNISAGRLAADSTDAVNGSQLYTLSNSTSTGLSSLSTNLNEVTKNQLGSLSTIVTNSLSTVTENVSSLSTGLRETNTNVAALQQNALQWNSTSNAYDAIRSNRAQRLTGIIGGDISLTSTDAINGAQMYSLSTLTQAGLSSSSTGLSSLSNASSAALTTVNDRVDTLTSTTQLGLASASTGLTSLSSSTSTGLTSLTSSLSSTNQNLTTLQQNALQWNGSAYDAGRNGAPQLITNVAAGRVSVDSTDVVNGGQLFSLSSSTSTGLSSLSTNLNEVTKNQLGSLSTIVNDSLSTVTKNVSSLSTGLIETNSNVTALQQNALLRNRISGNFDASREGKDQRLTGIAAGDINITSSDAINGTQMYSLSTLTQAGLSSTSTGLSSLSSASSAALTTVNDRVDTLTSTTQLGLASASTGLTSLSSSTSTGLTSLASSLSSTNQNLTTLQQNALQWNSTLGAYDAGHGSGTAQRITNVAAGSVTVDSTDAVNGSQLYALSGSTSTGLSSLSTVVSSTVISGINSISSSMSTGYESLSRSMSTTSDSLNKLTSSTSTALSSLSTSYDLTQKDVKQLKDKSLQWDEDKGGFDAGKTNSLTRAATYGKVINLADGSVDQGSHDAINGGQLYLLKNDVTSLSTGTSTSLSSLNSALSELSTGNIITNITNLTQNALLWNGSAYDASHGSATAQHITNVADGNMAKGSLDAINAGQLWAVRQDYNNLSTMVNSLPTSNVSDDSLNSLSTSVSTIVASQIASIASALGTSRNSAGSINPPKYDISTPTGGNVSADNVADALQNLENYGTKYVKINSAKAGSIAQGANSIAVGGAAMASGTSAIAIGDSASAPAANGVALGSNAQVKQTGGIALGAGSVASVAAGQEGYIPVTATSQQAAAIRATRSTEGAVSVGDASKGVYRQITGVAAGTADTDAVNVAQLKGVDNQVTRVNEYVNQLNDNIHHVERRAYSGTAMAMALSGAYLPSLSSGEQTVGIGVGAYRSYGAVGVNYKAASKNGKVTWGAGVSTTGKEVAFNSVLGFKW
ncbi:ESPR-type extended signal peptide-containing protein [Snodgrassella alvi]|uniref:ESPR-type extended signal peptide-containing protein n=1 Tax=Snodgrassella alvi TaxID=1196083 RepID=UPI003513558A